MPEGFSLISKTFVDGPKCLDLVGENIKGAEIPPGEILDRGTGYRFTLNTGQELWQSCTVDTRKRTIHTVARSNNPANQEK